MRTIHKILCTVLLLSQSVYPAACHAWSNYFRFVNNLNVPLLLSINPSVSNVNNLCGGSTTNVEVNSHSLSCEFEFNTNLLHWPNNAGTITITKKNDPNSYCVFPYSYTTSILNYFDMRSEFFSEPTCHGNLKSGELSVINNHIQALPRPLAGNIILGLDQGKSYKFTQSLSEADCGEQGGNNCIIASPDMNTLYMPNGSSLQQSIVLQNELDRYEPLNFEQMIGSHNAAISRHYTTSTNDYNMSYADPDNYLTLTEQLNFGIRQIELDIEWYKNAITVCHNHISKDLGGILCEGNFPLQSAISEIKSWTEKNPEAFIIIYLDANLPITGHITDLDAALSILDSYIFTPAMATNYYHVTDNALPLSQLTQDNLIHQFKKTIIITNDNNVEDIKNSQYVFVKTQNTNSTPLDEAAIDTFLQSNHSVCDHINKYTNIKNLYGNDPNHYNMLRLNADRTTINYISSVGSASPEDYVDYYTLQNTPNILSCPFNIFSSNMFGFTCDATTCNHHPTDPRLYAFLWSWELGYPVTNGSHIAYINPKTGHFENASLQAHNTYSVLCAKSISQNAPTEALSWYIEEITLSDVSNIHHTAQAACTRTGGLFVVPTTSYRMQDALSVINVGDKVNPYPILVDYENVTGKWTPNK